jgi:hypothetical protein
VDVWFYIEKGTTAERHESELRNLKNFFSRSKRVRRAFAALIRTYLGYRLLEVDLEPAVQHDEIVNAARC